MRRGAIHFLLTLLALSSRVVLAFGGIITWDEAVTVPNRHEAQAPLKEWHGVITRRHHVWLSGTSNCWEGRFEELQDQLAPIDQELDEIDARSMRGFGYPTAELLNRDDTTILETLFGR